MPMQTSLVFDLPFQPGYMMTLPTPADGKHCFSSPPCETMIGCYTIGNSCECVTPQTYWYVLASGDCIRTTLAYLIPFSSCGLCTACDISWPSTESRKFLAAHLASRQFPLMLLHVLLLLLMLILLMLILLLSFWLLLMLMLNVLDSSISC